MSPEFDKPFNAAIQRFAIDPDELQDYATDLSAKNKWPEKVIIYPVVWGVNPNIESNSAEALETAAAIEGISEIAEAYAYPTSTGVYVILLHDGDPDYPENMIFVGLPSKVDRDELAARVTEVVEKVNSLLDKIQSAHRL